jgi:hypothetical protein
MIPAIEDLKSELCVLNYLTWCIDQSFSNFSFSTELILGVDTSSVSSFNMQVLAAPVLVERTIAGSGFSVNGTVARRLDGPGFDSDWIQKLRLSFCGLFRRLFALGSTTRGTACVCSRLGPESAHRCLSRASPLKTGIHRDARPYLVVARLRVMLW